MEHDRERSKWTGRRGRMGGFFLANKLSGQGEELIFGPSVSAVLEEISSLISGNEAILDVGCGSSRLSLPIAQKLDTSKIVCLDLSEEMLARLERRAHAAGLAERIEIIKAPASASGLEGNPVDITISNNVLHELQEPAQAIVEHLRALKAGGHLIVSDFRETRLVKLIISSHHKGVHGPHTREGVESLLKDAGAQDVRITTNRHRLVVHARK